MANKVSLSIGHTPNYARVTIGPVTLYFSYETVIAVSDPFDSAVRENVWGPTTGKHLNRVDGGSKEAKARRLDSEAFEAVLSRVLSRYGLEV